MTEGLVDKRAYLNTFGCLLLDSSLIDDIDRPLDRTDFNTEKFHELLFIAFYNLYMQGCITIDEFSIDSYLSKYKDQYDIFQKNNGIDYLVNAREMATLENYDYYYHRLRKYSLLRYYENQGLDTRFIYDNTIVDTTEMEREQAKFDDYTEIDIIEQVESLFVIAPNMQYCVNALTTDIQAGQGMNDLVDELMETPDIGVPLNSDALNTIARGARLGCLYMRAALQGQGKTRLAAADACKIAIPYFYDEKSRTFIHSGFSEPTVYFTTEMPVEEIQTLIVAAISKVNEAHILDGKYDEGEFERVKQAISYIESSPLYIVHIPDFTIEDIKNQIKKYKREFGVNYFFFDYIHTSLRLMAEISNKSRMGLKEHQLLLIFATELKTIAQQLKIFIFTACQLNGEAANAQYKDQNLLAGAKALANKLDVGVISIVPNKADMKKIEPLLHKFVNMPVPNMCHWIYKVRRGKLTRIIVWSKVDLGTMSEQSLFVTTYDYEIINIDFTRIEQVEDKIKEHSILLTKIKDKLADDKNEIEEQETEGNASWGQW